MQTREWDARGDRRRRTCSTSSGRQRSGSHLQSSPERRCQRVVQNIDQRSNGKLTRDVALLVALHVVEAQQEARSETSVFPSVYPDTRQGKRDSRCSTGGCRQSGCTSQGEPASVLSLSETAKQSANRLSKPPPCVRAARDEKARREEQAQATSKRETGRAKERRKGSDAISFPSRRHGNGCSTVSSSVRSLRRLCASSSPSPACMLKWQKFGGHVAAESLPRVCDNDVLPTA